MTRRAMILFAHGARDPRWAEPFQRLQMLTQAQLGDVDVSLAFLEFIAPTLSERVQQLMRTGCHEVTVVPVFLGQGGHVLRDLPAMAEQLRITHSQLVLKIAKAVGEDLDVLKSISRYCVETLELLQD